MLAGLLFILKLVFSALLFCPVAMAESSKKSRSTKKAILTRHLNTLNRRIVEDDVGATREYLRKVRQAFNELEASHYDYKEILTVEDDVAACDDWLSDVEATYLAKVKEAVAFLKDNQDVSGDVEQADFVTLLNAPKVELDAYDGDPMQYNTFISLFDEVVGNNNMLTSGAKLTRLMQYTAGEAKRAISGCAVIGGEAGYNKAREILSSRFGNSHLAANKIITSITPDKSVKGKKEI